MRETLLAVQKMSGKTPRELIGPECPEPLLHVWMWFLKLGARRSVGMSGGSLITHLEMDAFFRRRKLDPQIWEIELLEQLDELYMKTNPSEKK